MNNETAMTDERKHHCDRCLSLLNTGIFILPVSIYFTHFCFAWGASADHLLGPAGHLLTPATAYVRLLQDPPGASKKPTN